MTYVIVLVTYDYYRFQDNLGAGTDKTTVMEYARKLRIPDLIGSDRKLKIVSYVRNGKIANRFDDAEIDHIWIQKLTNK